MTTHETADAHGKPAADMAADRARTSARRPAGALPLSLVDRYALPPGEIEPLSRSRLHGSLRLPPDLGEDQAEVVARVVYATGDPSIAPAVRVHPDALALGAFALRLGRPIIVDVKMVRAGIDRRLASRFGCPIVCAIDHPEVIARAAAARLPRAVEAMRYLAPEIDGAVVVIGNAPTALLALLDLVDAGAVAPAMIVGTPVGFVAAAESKAELMARGIPYVTVEGTRGGSAAAVTVVNTLLRRAGAAPSAAARTAVLFLGHGSVQPAAGLAMETVLAAVRGRAGLEIVEHAYLAMAAPSIPEGVRRCVAQGAARIVTVPYFLHLGRHMLRDLPDALRAQQAAYPEVEIVLGRHIGLHPDLTGIMLDRIAESWRLPGVDAVDFTADYYNGGAIAPPRRGEGDSSRPPLPAGSAAPHAHGRAHTHDHPREVRGDGC